MHVTLNINIRYPPLPKTVLGLRVHVHHLVAIMMADGLTLKWYISTVLKPVSSSNVFIEIMLQRVLTTENRVTPSSSLIVTWTIFVKLWGSKIWHNYLRLAPIKPYRAILVHTQRIKLTVTWKKLMSFSSLQNIGDSKEPAARHQIVKCCFKELSESLLCWGTI